MTEKTPTYSTLYKTAEVLHSGKFYKVLGQNAYLRSQATHLLLDVDGSKQWHPINELAPTL